MVEAAGTRPVARHAVEIVERKGLGHPDTVCDFLAEAISRRLCAAYLEVAGRILHHNIENAFLVAGSSTPAWGGGRVDAPMRFVYGDRATSVVDGRPVPVAELAQEAAFKWFRENLPLVDPVRHVVFQNELKPASVQLADLFDRGAPGAGDTCVGSGYAPLTETEEIVLAVEREVNSSAFKERFPATGQDVKVTGVRTAGRLSLVLSLAFVDRYIASEAEYFDVKAAVATELAHVAQGRLRALDAVDVTINTLDAPGRDVAGVYLTVLGTAADSADGGEVGRGNRPNGINAFSRPTASGGVAGKNPVSNVGKIYTLFAHEAAARVAAEVRGVAEAYVTLCSRIGDPIDRPYLTAVRLVPQDGVAVEDLSDPAATTVAAALDDMDAFVARLVAGELPVC